MAAETGDLDALELVVKHAPHRMHEMKDGGTTPLGKAAWHVQQGAVELLLQAKAALNQADNNGYTPLHVASCGVQSTAGGTPIHNIRLLLEAKAKINLGDNYGYTPLHMAAVNDRHSAITQLLAARAAVNKTTTTDGFTPCRVTTNNEAKRILREAGGK